MMSWKITVLAPELAYEKKRLRATMRSAGAEIVQVTRKLIRGGTKSGRLYRKPGGGYYRASAPGEAPASRSGSLAGKIKVNVARNGLAVEIREQARYAWILEHGRNSPLRKKTRKVSGKLVTVGRARRLEPRPSLTRALADRGPSIQKRIEESVALDLQFVRQKA